MPAPTMRKITHEECFSRPPPIMRKITYEECISKFRIEYPTKKVDNDPPQLVFAMRSCIGDAHRMDTLMAENKQLLQRLSTIYRSNGVVDCSPPKCAYVSNFSDRLRRLVKIERENIDILCQIHETEPAVPTARSCNQQWKKALRDLNKKSKYPFQFASNERVWLPLPSLKPQKRRVECAPRVHAFMEFTSGQGRFLGRIELELFKNQAPKLVENFLAFTTGKGPDGSSYIDSEFYQILPGYYVMGGDILKNNGSGVLSIQGETSIPADENDLSHCEPGLLCTPISTTGSCDSKFMITMKPLTIIDNRSTVFGRVILGHEVLKAINVCGSKPSGKVTSNVFCSNCGAVKVPKEKRAPKSPSIGSQSNEEEEGG